MSKYGYSNPKSFVEKLTVETARSRKESKDLAVRLARAETRMDTLEEVLEWQKKYEEPKVTGKVSLDYDRTQVID